MKTKRLKKTFERKIVSSFGNQNVNQTEIEEKNKSNSSPINVNQLPKYGMLIQSDELPTF